jgi:hypothetical protein
MPVKQELEDFEAGRFRSFDDFVLTSNVASKSASRFMKYRIDISSVAQAEADSAFLQL